MVTVAMKQLMSKAGVSIAYLDIRSVNLVIDFYFIWYHLLKNTFDLYLKAECFLFQYKNKYFIQVSDI